MFSDGAYDCPASARGDYLEVTILSQLAFDRLDTVWARRISETFIPPAPRNMHVFVFESGYHPDVPTNMTVDGWRDGQLIGRADQEWGAPFEEAPDRCVYQRFVFVELTAP
jgi:hypothetical protein